MYRVRLFIAAATLAVSELQGLGNSAAAFPGPVRLGSSEKYRRLAKHNRFALISFLLNSADLVAVSRASVP